jgi:phospholipase/carboxylesterase
VSPYRFTVEGAERLIAMGADVTADVLPFVKHEIDADILALVVERLQGHVPKRLWDEAMRAGARLAPASSDRDGEPTQH